MVDPAEEEEDFPEVVHLEVAVAHSEGHPLDIAVVDHLGRQQDQQ